MAEARASKQKTGSELLEKLLDDATYKEFLNIAKGKMPVCVKCGKNK
jgi:hypothetical protein